MTKVQNPTLFDWANEAFVDPNSNMQHAEKWAPVQRRAFGIPSTLFNLASIEQYGHATPPEELSPADAHQDVRGCSTSRKQWMDEVPWPKKHIQSQSPTRRDGRPGPTHRYTNRQPTANRSQASTGSPAQQDANPQPLKRKRGRHEIRTVDEYPFHVSSTRQAHMEKNRVAAHKYRNRKTEYIHSLEGHARGFSSKNRLLRENVAMLHEEVLDLKNEVLCHAGCGDWEIDGYLEQCTYNILGMKASMRTPTTPHSSDHSPTMNTNQRMEQRHDSTDTMPSQLTVASIPDADKFEGFDLLQDFEDVDMDDQK